MDMWPLPCKLQQATYTLDRSSMVAAWDSSGAMLAHVVILLDKDRLRSATPPPHIKGVLQLVAQFPLLQLVEE